MYRKRHQLAMAWRRKRRSWRGIAQLAIDGSLIIGAAAQLYHKAIISAKKEMKTAGSANDSARRREKIISSGNGRNMKSKISALIGVAWRLNTACEKLSLQLASSSAQWRGSSVLAAAAKAASIIMAIHVRGKRRRNGGICGGSGAGE